MKKATINNLTQVDLLAEHYHRSGHQATIMEIAVDTRGQPGEVVKLTQLEAHRKVIHSRYLESTKVVHITAHDWRLLRGVYAVYGAEELRMARQIVEAEDRTPPAPHATAPSKRRAATGNSSRTPHVS